MSTQFPEFTYLTTLGGTEIPPDGETTSTGVEAGGRGPAGSPFEILDKNEVLRRGSFNTSSAFIERFLDLSPGLHHFKLRENSSALPTSEWKFTVVAFAYGVKFINAPYRLAPGGRLKNIRLSVTAADSTPMPNTKVTVTLPPGFLHADGSSGAKDYISGPDGVVTVSGITGTAPTGTYTLQAISGSQSDSAQLTMIRQAPVGTVVGLTGSWACAMSPCGTLAYTTSDGAVAVIDTETNEIIARVGEFLSLIAVHPDGIRIYASSNSDNSVTVIETETNTVIDKIPTGRSTWGIAVSPDGERVYAANQGGNSVSAIDAGLNTVIKTISVGTTPYDVVFHPNGTLAYVACGGSNSVSVIDTSTNTEIQTIGVGEAVSIAIHPSGDYLYVGNIKNTTVSVIETATNRVITNVTVPAYPYGIAFNKNGSRAYVSNSASQNISILDTATHTVIQNIPLDTQPIGIALTPDNTRIYIASNNANMPKLRVMAI